MYDHTKTFDETPIFARLMWEFEDEHGFPLVTVARMGDEFEVPQGGTARHLPNLASFVDTRAGVEFTEFPMNPGFADYRSSRLMLQTPGDFMASLIAMLRGAEREVYPVIEVTGSLDPELEKAREEFERGVWIDSNELPGMWEASDLHGGQADSENEEK